MRPPLTHLAASVFDTPLMIMPSKLQVILAAVGPRLVADQDALQSLIESGVFSSGDIRPYSSYNPRAAWDDDSSSSPTKSEKPYQLTDAGVAIIPVKGVLMKEGGWMSALSGCSSYSSITKAINAAMSDPQCRAVLFNINSPGGTTHGCFELSDLIHSYRGKKPMLAVANDLAASAAYAIASSADSVYLTRTGGVGSVGVFCLHCSQKGADKQAGMEYTYIFYGDHKVEGNPHESLSSVAEASLQREVNREGDIFVATVARNRSKSPELIKGTKADVLFADSSIPLLADKVGTYDDALAELTGKILGNSVTIPVSSGRRSESANSSQGETDMVIKAAVGSTVSIDTLRKQAADATQAVKDAEAAAVLDTAATAVSLPATSAGTTFNITNAAFHTAPVPINASAATSAGTPADDEDDEDDDEKAAVTGTASASACDNSDHEEGCTGTGAGHAYASPKGKKGKKMSTPAAIVPGASAPAANTAANAAALDTSAASAYTVEMASETSDLCALVGQDKLAAKFIREKTSVAKVREHLINLRAAESSATAVNSSFGTVSTDSLASLDQQATALCASNPNMSKTEARYKIVRSNPKLYNQYCQERAVAAATPEGTAAYVQMASAHMAEFGLSTHTTGL